MRGTRVSGAERKGEGEKRANPLAYPGVLSEMSWVMVVQPLYEEDWLEHCRDEGVERRKAYPFLNLKEPRLSEIP
jgi:hypothetical protein